VDISDFLDIKRFLDQNDIGYNYTILDHERGEYVDVSIPKRKLMFTLADGTIVSSKFVNFNTLEIRLTSDDNGFVNKLFEPIYW